MKVVLDLDKQQLEEFYIILKNVKLDYTNSLEMRNTLGKIETQISELYRSTLRFNEELEE